MHYVLVDAICAAAGWRDAVFPVLSSKTPDKRLPSELEAPAVHLLDYIVSTYRTSVRPNAIVYQIRRAAATRSGRPCRPAAGFPACDNIWAFNVRSVTNLRHLCD